MSARRPIADAMAAGEIPAHLVEPLTVLAGRLRALPGEMERHCDLSPGTAARIAAVAEAFEADLVRDLAAGGFLSGPAGATPTPRQPADVIPFNKRGGRADG